MHGGWTIEQRKEMYLEYLRNGQAAHCPLDRTRLRVSKLDQLLVAPIMVFACPTCQRAFQSTELI